MKSNQLVEGYIEQLPAERQPIIRSVRDLIVSHLPSGYDESINWGMISYEIPLERYPHTYNKQPLTYISLGAQKNYNTLHLMSIYQSPEEEAWFSVQCAQAGKKLNMGKSCVRFRNLSELPLEVIGQIVARTDPETFIQRYEAIRERKVR